jgi:hypothetical protein
VHSPEAGGDIPQQRLFINNFAAAVLVIEGAEDTVSQLLRNAARSPIVLWCVGMGMGRGMGMGVRVGRRGVFTRGVERMKMNEWTTRRRGVGGWGVRES